MTYDLRTERLKAELKEELLQANDMKAWLSHLPTPDSRAIARARADARALAADPADSPVRLGRLVAAGALAALVLVAVSRVHPSTPATEAAVALDLAPSAEPTIAAPGVVLTANGTGTVSGTEKNVEIDWRSGELGVSVEHGAGINLTVHTREADVHVVGTIFEVDRDALGTRVRVTRGKVAVQCGGEGSMLEVVPGVETTCMPRSGAGNLARARALLEAGETGDKVLGALDRGLLLSPEGEPVHDEIEALRIETLAGLNRKGEAIAAARAFLDTKATLRRTEVARILLRLGYDAQGCAAISPPVARELSGDTDPKDRTLLQACGITIP